MAATYQHYVIITRLDPAHFDYLYACSVSNSGDPDLRRMATGAAAPAVVHITGLETLLKEINETKETVNRTIDYPRMFLFNMKVIRIIITQLRTGQTCHSTSPMRPAMRLV